MDPVAKPQKKRQEIGFSKCAAALFRFRVCARPGGQKGSVVNSLRSFFNRGVTPAEAGRKVIMKYNIREIKKSEYPLLNDFLYEAIFVPEGEQPPSRSILSSPELQVYVSCFGEYPDDKGLVAEVDGRVVGAVWVRIMDDYGHVDNDTPSFAISLYPEYRGGGIGTAMMEAMLTLLKRSGYARASLAVQKANYAVRMYKKTGFQIIGENSQEYIMVNDLASYE